MRRLIQASAIVSVGVLILVAAGQPVAGQSSEYGISVDGSIDTPDRDVTFEGESYQVTAVKQSDPGDTVTVNVEAPSDRLVDVVLYNSDRQIVEQKTLSSPGSGSVDFDLSSLSAGSYTFAVQYSGDTKVVHPLVVRAYTVSLTAPSEATSEETIGLSATLTELRSASTSGVEFVILNSEQTLRIDATKQGDTYEATADLSSLNTGSYSVYATVRGTEEFDGNKVRLGLSQPQSLTINEESTTTTSDGSSGGGGGGGGGGSGGGVVAPSTATATTQASTTVSEPATTTTAQRQTASGTTESARTPDTTTGPTETDTTVTTPEQEIPTTGTGTTTTGSNVITPQSPTSTASQTTATTGPGFGAGLASIAALGGAVTLARRRQRR